MHEPTPAIMRLYVEALRPLVYNACIPQPARHKDLSWTGRDPRTPACFALHHVSVTGAAMVPNHKRHWQRAMVPA